MHLCSYIRTARKGRLRWTLRHDCSSRMEVRGHGAPLGYEIAGVDLSREMSIDVRRSRTPSTTSRHLFRAQAITPEHRSASAGLRPVDVNLSANTCAGPSRGADRVEHRGEWPPDRNMDAGTTGTPTFRTFPCPAAPDPVCAGSPAPRRQSGRDTLLRALMPPTDALRMR